MTVNKITLRDIYNVVNRLEDKMDKRVSGVCNRVDILENIVVSNRTKLGVFSIINTSISVLLSGIAGYFGWKGK